MHRTVLQLFGVFAFFFELIGPHSTYCRDFEQKYGVFERIAASESESRGNTLEFVK
jgi:hypothetical protein